MSPRAQRSLAAALATFLSGLSLLEIYRGIAAWLVPSTVAIVVATSCGALGRRARLPSLVVPLLTPVGLIGLVTGVGAPDHAFLRVIPTRTTLTELHTLIQSGFDDVRTYPAPAPTTPGLILLTAAGVFVVAALVDLLAVTASRPVLAGVPLLALYGVPAALRPGGTSIWHFLVASGGWVLLLTLDGRERLGRWGRVLGRQQSAPGTSVVVGGAAGRVAGLSLGAAAVLPLLFPSLGSGLFGTGGGDGLGGGGGGSVAVVPPLVTVQSELHDDVTTSLFTVSTPSAQFYRLTPLDNFDGNTFTLNADSADGKGVANLPGTPGLGDTPTERVDATVHVGALAEHYLPVPYSPVSVAIDGHWQLAPHLRTIFNTRDTTQDRTYTVTSEVPAPSALQLTSHPQAYDATQANADTRAQLQLDLSLPSTLTPVVAQIAREQTKGATTDFARLLALQEYFTNGKTFIYDLAAQLEPGNAGLTQFLTQTHRGYCEQFASAFTLMARSLGIPARVAVGFTPGTQGPPGVWTVTNKDAHAWPEAWFDGVGWLKFEPTPRVGLDTVAPGYTRSLPPVAPQQPSTATAAPTKAPSPGATRAARDPDPRDLPDVPFKAPAAAGHGLGVGTLGVLVTLVLILLTGLTPAGSRALLRRRRARAAGGSPRSKGRGPDGGSGGGSGGGGSGGGSGGGGSPGGGSPGAGAPGGGTEGGVPAGELVSAAVAAEAAHAAWAELLDTAADIRVPLRAADSPRATGRRIESMLPAPGWLARQPSRPVGGRAEVLGAGEESTRPAHEGSDRSTAEAARLALARIARAEERARYAPGAVEVPAPVGLADDAALVRRSLLGGQPRGVRLRALLLPPSTIARVRGAVGGMIESVSAAFGRIPASLGGRLRTLVQRG